VSAEVIRIDTDAPAGAAFSTRRGGVSAGRFGSLNLGSDKDDPDANVRANRAALCAVLGLDADVVEVNRQVHGAEVRAVGPATGRGLFTGALRGWPDADGLMTREPATGLLVLGADCLPVLLWRRDEPAVAAAHAGWRGLVAGVLEAAARSLGDTSRVGAAIGPGIGPCCYPVSPEVRDVFAGRFGEGVVAGEAVDLATSAEIALASAGVPPEAVQRVDACTSCEPERFFSYRRDGVCGRHGGVVWAVV
jgi:hypothetical protein